MATEESKATEKKPPAHEVIVNLLRQYAHKWQQAIAGGATTEQREIIVRNSGRAEALVLTLMRMHIPENALQWVADALHHLPPNFLPPMVVDLYAEIEGDTGGA